MNIKRLSLEEWKIMSEEAHRLCFSEECPAELNTCDYALLMVNEKDEPMGYMTILTMDKGTAYMQHGGAFPEFAGTTKTARGFHLMMSFLKEQHGRITARIKNTNTSMLKLAISADMFVNGIECICGDVYLNLSWAGVKK